MPLQDGGPFHERAGACPAWVGKWLPVQPRHASVAVECIVQESMQRAPVLGAGRPSGSLWVATSQRAQRAGVISQGGFRTRPLTNHVSSFVAGPEGSNPRPRRTAAVLLRTVYIALAGSPPSGYFGCLKRSAAVEGRKRDGGSQWLAPRLRGSSSFFFGRCNLMERTARKYGANREKKQAGKVPLHCTRCLGDSVT